MGETADQIRNEIEEKRAKLGQDLNQLEYKVKRETDWRVQFDRRPWAFMGAAFTSAVLFGLIIGAVGRR
jgi:hypothetical protein